MIFKPLIAALLFGVAAGAGITNMYQAKVAHRESEDMALRGLMEHLAAQHYIQENNIDEASATVNVSMNGYISSLRKYDGSIEDANWRKTRIRMLSAVAVMWEKHPPAVFDRIRASKEDWVQDWEQEMGGNVQLLKWAKQQCIEHLEYDCKSTRKNEK